MAKRRYEYLLFGLLGEYFGTKYSLKEANAHADRAPGVYYYRRQVRMDEGQTIG